MGKKINYENYRVTIYPRSLGDLGVIKMSDYMMCSSEEDRQAQYRERCHEIKSQIKRHIDNVHVVSVEFDTVKTCEHCAHEWTEKNDEYNGGCCVKDEEASYAPSGGNDG